MEWACKSKIIKEIKEMESISNNPFHPCFGCTASNCLDCSIFKTEAQLRKRKENPNSNYNRFERGELIPVEAKFICLKCNGSGVISPKKIFFLNIQARKCNCCQGTGVHIANAVIQNTEQKRLVKVI